jgi:hypothetical protein
MVYFRALGNYGRLGNQLFQIAAASSLALENNDIAVFPHWEYNHYFSDGIRTDDVENFRISRDYQETAHAYQKIPYVDGINLIGFFQSEKYFKNHSNEIKKLFTLKEEYEKELKEKWKEELKNSLSIHVRRDDYVQSESIGGVHVCPPMSYFTNSMSYIESSNRIDNILVFSDDIQWCKDNFKDPRCVFIENQINIFDMFLMSYCDHNVTTNSTFSWWASWLNKNGGVITSPKKWFNRPDFFWADIYFENQKII